VGGEKDWLCPADGHIVGGGPPSLRYGIQCYGGGRWWTCNHEKQGNCVHMDGWVTPITLGYMPFSHDFTKTMVTVILKLKWRIIVYILY